MLSTHISQAAVATAVIQAKGKLSGTAVRAITTLNIALRGYCLFPSWQSCWRHHQIQDRDQDQDRDRDNRAMQKPSSSSTIDLANLHLYQDLLATVIQSRIQMDVASARADLLLDIFLIRVEQVGTEESFVERTINHLELDMLDARDAPELLREATADTARAVWAYHTNPTVASDQVVRDAFERWEAVYQRLIGEPPSQTYMDIENARCLAESDYYSTPPLPFSSRAMLNFGNQN